MDKKIPVSFSGTMINATEVNRQITKGRLRIFYPGENRNGSYMSLDFCERLLRTLPYTPVVGIYDEIEEDFLSHSPNSNDAQIYGVVPENPNITQERFLDEDGIERNYFVCDVYLYTKRLDAAKKIIGKQHSLELDPTTIQGNWETINGKILYKYTSADFLGLSVLGDSKTPCFEGSAFFELVSQFDLFMRNQQEGGTRMIEDKKDFSEVNTEEKKSIGPVDDLKSDGDKISEEILLDSANSSAEVTAVEEPVEQLATETSSTVTEEVAEDAPQDNSVASQSTGTDAESGTDTAGESFETTEEVTEEVSEETPVAEVEPEMKSEAKSKDNESEVENSESTQENNFEEQIVALQNQISEKDAKIVEFETLISTLRSEAETLQSDFNTLKAQYDVLAEEKNIAETAEKEKLLTEYSKFLDTSTLEAINPANFSVKELEKELLFASKEVLLNNQEKFALLSVEDNEVGNEDRAITLLRKQKERKY